MGLFSTIKEPVFIKRSSNAEKQITQLREYREQASEYIKNIIDQDIKMLSAGIAGEENIAFELKNSHIPMLVLHDLCLQIDGFTAQIDYLIITKKRNFVIECKNLIGDIEINSNGEFIRTIGHRREGIYSPITQNKRHLDVIKKLRAKEKKNIFSRYIFNKSFNDNYKSVVVLSNAKTILNSKYAKKEVKNQVIRADQLIEYINDLNDESDLYSASEKDMENLAQFFLNRHIENPTDYLNKYKKMTENYNQYIEQRHEQSQVACPKCGASMVKRIASRGINEGKEFWGCSMYPKCTCIINIKQED